jgi:hypothetical protein
MASEAARAESASSAEPPDLSSRWIDLLGNDAAPDLQPEMFDEAIAQLEELVETRPDCKEETIATLQRQFDRGLDHITWAGVTRSLANYCGVGPAYLVNWLVYQSTERRLAVVDQRASPAVVAYLRTVVTRFWDELNAIQIAVSSSVNDWWKIDKHVYYDALDGSYRPTISLTKVNGDVVVLEMTTDSLLNLARHLLVMVAAVGDVSDFSPERVGSFLNQLGPVLDLFNPPESAPADGVAAESSEAADAVPAVASSEAGRS